MFAMRTFFCEADHEESDATRHIVKEHCPAGELIYDVAAADGRPAMSCGKSSKYSAACAGLFWAVASRR